MGKMHPVVTPLLTCLNPLQTYNTDQQTPDSAGTATAYFCGVKTKAGAIGVDDQVEYGSCSSIENAAVESVLTQSQKAG